MRNNLITVFLLATTWTLIMSCNRAFLPKKSRVLCTQDGYLFDQHDKELFIPMNIKLDFLNEVNNKKAYKIAGSRETRGPIYLKKDSFDVNMHFNIDGAPKDTFSMEEKIYVARVRITYAPFEIKRRVDKNGPIGFDYHGKSYLFMSYDSFEGDIYRINALDSLGRITGLAFD